MFDELTTVLCVFLLQRTTDVPESLQKADLKDFKVITTIGVGGFGRVELVGFVCT